MFPNPDCSDETRASHFCTQLVKQESAFLGRIMKDYNFHDRIREGWSYHSFDFESDSRTSNI